MGEVVVREARAEDLPLLLEGMKPEERAEIAAVGAGSLKEEVSRTYLMSTMSWSAFHEGRLVGMFGVIALSMFSRTGIPWLLCTEEVKRVPVAFLKIGREKVLEMKARYPVLSNVVDARYPRGLEAMKRLGFTAEPAEPFGLRGESFHRISMGV